MAAGALQLLIIFLGGVASDIALDERTVLVVLLNRLLAARAQLECFTTVCSLILEDGLIVLGTLCDRIERIE